LESALAIAEELKEGEIAYSVEAALDRLRAGDTDRLAGKLS
jgi:hypothetical protein